MKFINDHYTLFLQYAKAGVEIPLFVAHNIPTLVKYILDLLLKYCIVLYHICFKKQSKTLSEITFFTFTK